MLVLLSLLLLIFPAKAGLHCRPYRADGCVLTACVGSLGDYPAPVVALLPARARSLRVHLHGFSERMDAAGVALGPYHPAYDWDNVRYPSVSAATAAFATGMPESPAKLLSTYGMGQQMCQLREAVVIPTSRGRCDTYAQVFTSPAAFGKFVTNTHEALGLPALPLHLSGHSGAGKIMKLILGADVPTLARLERITAYDAFYHRDETRALTDWALRRGGRQLRVMVLRPGPPEEHARRAWATPVHSFSNGSSVQTHALPASAGHDHWSLVRDNWVSQ